MGTGSFSGFMASLCCHYDIKTFGKIFGEALPSAMSSFFRKAFVGLDEEIMKESAISIFI